MSRKLRIGLAAGFCAGVILAVKICRPASAPDVRPRQRPAFTAPLGSETPTANRAQEPEAPAAFDPFRALALAQAEPDAGHRETLIQEVLRVWGATDPAAAIQWVRTQGVIDFTQAITSVFQGAVRAPETAIELARISSTQDPEHARDYGASLVIALGNKGDFQLAATFAAESTETSRLELLTTACAAWAGQKPHDALDFAGQLPPDIRRDAFNATISRWANTDAKSVADYAQTLDSKEDRTFALSAALRAWSANDPVGAADWINRQIPTPELDLATAVIASHPDTLENPAEALSLADSITNRPLRMRILMTVLNRWAATDAVLAQKYADSLMDLSPEERLNVRSAFSPGFEPMSFLP